MADTTVDERPQPPLEGEVVTETQKPGTAEPLAQEAPSMKGKGLIAWETFETEMNARADQIASMLPSNVSRDRFLNSIIAAVKQNPDLLFCVPRTLFTAIVKSAQDGLIPDGSEGVILPYNNNVAKRGEPDRWEQHAQWNPMVKGIRKRAREIDGILIDAQVVHMQDHFLWEQGDEPRIEHTPAKLGTPRGVMIGSYAIFKREDGTILAREVMDAEAVTATSEQSKNKNGLMWTKFASEGWRKAVIRRGSKSVPAVSPALAQVINRDDENFDFGEPARFIEHENKATPAKASPGGHGSAFNRRPAAQAAKTRPSAAQDVQQADSGQEAQDAVFEDETPMERGKRLLALCQTTNDVADLRASIAEELAKDEIMLAAWNAACDGRSQAMTAVAVRK